MLQQQMVAEQGCGIHKTDTDAASVHIFHHLDSGSALGKGIDHIGAVCFVTIFADQCFRVMQVDVLVGRNQIKLNVLFPEGQFCFCTGCVQCHSPQGFRFGKLFFCGVFGAAEHKHFLGMGCFDFLRQTQCIAVQL